MTVPYQYFFRSLSTKKVTDVQTVAEKQTKVKVLIKSTSNLPDIISEQQLIPSKFSLDCFSKTF